MAIDYSLITRQHLIDAASDLGVSLPVIRAVAAVEGRGTGFIRNSRLPVVLFEGHYFSRLTGGVFDGRAPTLSYPRWTKAHYEGGRGEYQRIMKAIEINDENPGPALQSTSWGMFQIMGANHAAAGYETVEEFVNWMAMGEDHHLRAFVAFVKSMGLAPALRDQRWAEFAAAYNGPGFRKNSYDTRLAQEFATQRRQMQAEDAGQRLELERGDVVRLQAALNALLRTRLSVDGWMGDRTSAAIKQCQSHFGLEPTGIVDAALCEALGLDMDHYLQGEAA